MIISALKKGKISSDTLEFCLENTTYMDSEMSENPLVTTVRSNRMDYCKILVYHGYSSLYNTNPTVLTPFHLSASSPKYIEFLRFFLSFNIFIDSKFSACGETPIEVAAVNGNVEAVQLLMDHKSKYCKQALGRAVRHGRLGVVDLLLESGTPIDDKLMNHYFITCNNRTSAIAKYILRSCVAAGRIPTQYNMIIDHFRMSRSSVFTLRTLCVQTIRRHNIDAPKILCFIPEHDLPRENRKRKR